MNVIQPLSGNGSEAFKLFWAINKKQLHWEPLRMGREACILEDLFIKRTDLDTTALKREAKNLELIHNMYKNLPSFLENIQKGIFYAKTSRFQYLVSQTIKGRFLDLRDSTMNRKNLHSLMQTISTLDKGDLKEGRFIHGDWFYKNILLSSKKAHLIDFEEGFTVKPEELRKTLKENPPKPVLNFYSYINSDTAPTPTNLKQFEIKVLKPLIEDSAKFLGPQKSQDMLMEYFKYKSHYHSSLFQYYKKSQDAFAFAAAANKAHAIVLRNPKPKITRSELLKIEIASKLSKSFLTLGKSGVFEQIQNCLKFFQECHQATSNPQERMYFQNCINFCLNLI